MCSIAFALRWQCVRIIFSLMPPSLCTFGRLARLVPCLLNLLADALFPPTFGCANEELVQYGRNAIAMRTHTDQLGYLLNVVREWALVEVAPVEHSPVSNIFQRLKMSRVRLIVANVELVVVHF